MQNKYMEIETTGLIAARRLSSVGVYRCLCLGYQAKEALLPKIFEKVLDT